MYDKIIEDTSTFANALNYVPADTGTLVLDDENCMRADGWEYDVNIMMIGNIITRPYSHSDAAFLTREPNETSDFQTHGKCFQSSTYPAVGVAVDFIVKDGFIVSVKHAMAVMGCK
jgi:hypothetical protein